MKIIKALVANLLLVFISQSFAVGEGFDPSFMANSGFTITSKNVGQGNCTIIRNHENNHTLIIDAGSSSDKPKNTNARLIEDFGFSEIHEDIPLMANAVTVIVSHSDQDHVNLFNIFALNTRLLAQVGGIYLGDHLSNFYRVDGTQTLLSDFFKRVPHINDKFVSLSHDLKDLNIADYLSDTVFPAAIITPDKYRGFLPRHPISRGFLTEKQRMNPKNIFEFIGVNAGAGKGTKEIDTNTNSAVVRLCIDGHNIIVMGDATGTTTNTILRTIADPSILNTNLLIVSHHGAEEEDANYISWAAVTQPKRVVFSSGFNRGYKHPTLTAVTNYLATGLIDNKAYSDPLWGIIFPDDNLHHISIYNTIGLYHRTLKPRIHGLEWGEADTNHLEWVRCRTNKQIYNTGTSGELRFRFSTQGILHYFWSEN